MTGFPKKDLGAFYTHPVYANLAARELVLPAANAAIKAGKKDYVILDRCAGTGNLESALIGLKDDNGDELISHCIVSTYEYWEYKVLNENIGDKVRHIIPSSEANVEYFGGKVLNADAMSEEYINNKTVKQYLDDEDCAVILFENLPYRDEVSDNSENRGAKVNQSFVFKELFDELKNLRNSSIATARDLSNQFIYSGAKHYLRQDTDSYIVFSPIKYWKIIGLIDLRFESGFLFNRKEFHATESAISCILWSNKLINQETANLSLCISIVFQIMKLKTMAHVLILKLMVLFPKSILTVISGKMMMNVESSVRQMVLKLLVENVLENLTTTKK